MTPVISIIVPVYNAENYVEKCIESVQAQSYTEWQMILVDDGSKDKSFEICQRYAANDNRITVIHQENAGAGAARNVALEKAKGKYVVFLDSDDYISPNYFELLSKHDEDVVFIDVQDVDANGKVLRREYMSPFKNSNLDDIIRFQMTGRLPWGGVRKAAKCQLLKDFNIRYSNHKVGEEALYSFNLLNNAKSVAFIEEPLYNYVQRGDSLSHTKTDDGWGPVAINLREQIKLIDESKHKGYTHYAGTLNAFILNAFSGSTRRLCQNYPYRLYVKKARVRRKLFFEQVDKDYPIDYKHISKKARILGFCAVHQLYSCIWFLDKLYTWKMSRNK